MKCLDIASSIEDESIQLEYALAVLTEAEQYFHNTDEWSYLPHRANQILLLLQTANDIIFRTFPEFSKAVDGLYKIHKNI